MKEDFKQHFEKQAKFPAAHLCRVLADLNNFYQDHEDKILSGQASKINFENQFVASHLLPLMEVSSGKSPMLYKNLQKYRKKFFYARQKILNVLFINLSKTHCSTRDSTFAANRLYDDILLDFFTKDQIGKILQKESSFGYMDLKIYKVKGKPKIKGGLIELLYFQVLASAYRYVGTESIDLFDRTVSSGLVHIYETLWPKANKVAESNIPKQKQPNKYYDDTVIKPEPKKAFDPKLLKVELKQIDARTKTVKLDKQQQETGESSIKDYYTMKVFYDGESFRDEKYKKINGEDVYNNDKFGFSNIPNGHFILDVIKSSARGSYTNTIECSNDPDDKEVIKKVRDKFNRKINSRIRLILKYRFGIEKIKENLSSPRGRILKLIYQIKVIDRNDL